MAFVLHDQQVVTEEYLLDLRISDIVLEIFARVSGVPLEACDVFEVAHTCIL